MSTDMATTVIQSRVAPAFIHISLCDNDFADDLQTAARMVFDTLGVRVTEELFCEAVVSMTNALSTLKSISRGWRNDSCLAYLKSEIKIIYSSKPPDIDHGGGSVAIDCNTRYIWRY